jgi:hypothetical protein
VTATAALALYEQRIWERAVRAQPRNRLGRRLFRWMWRHRLNPPFPGHTPARALLWMTVIELRDQRRREREARTDG